MAVDGYVKAAHAQLNSAISALQSEIGDLQRQLQNERQQIGGEVNKLNNEVKVHQVTIAQHDDQTEKEVLLGRIQAVAKKRDEKAAEVNRAEQDLSAAIQAKNQGLAEVQRALGAVNSLMSSSNLR